MKKMKPYAYLKKEGEDSGDEGKFYYYVGVD